MYLNFDEPETCLCSDRFVLLGLQSLIIQILTDGPKIVLCSSLPTFVAPFLICYNTISLPSARFQFELAAGLCPGIRDGSGESGARPTYVDLLIMVFVVLLFMVTPL